ncbi:hypothetical protein [Jannaschia sp. LMIT008]|uniref:hypothetical protein n=1 Tax=Jannaschia maritima TaxID=3032585 RepID=UPI0028116842|nr:hypothetical protein [Jannaschia sp. LMIT008]
MNPRPGFGPRVWAAEFGAYPEGVLALMGPMEVMPLDHADLLWLARQADAPSEFLAHHLDEAVDPFAATGAHFRLGLCSFKRGPGRLLPVFDGRQVMTTMAARNERVAQVARAVLAEGREDALYFRPWRDIPRWCEFRVFIRAGVVVGASQYHTDRRFPEIVADKPRIADVLRAAVDDLLKVLHVDDIVADFAVPPALDRQALLLELNPFVRRTGPGLFRWGGGLDGGDFDRTFRTL